MIHTKPYRLTCLLLFMLLSYCGKAQIMDTGHKVDTLSIANRLALRTNALGWACLTPNVGIEFDLQRYNYGHLALTLDARWNWETNNPYKTGTVYNICGARLGLRYYYRMRKYGDKKQYPQRQTGFVDRLLSCRTQEPHHPTIAFYRGIYVAYNKYSIKLGKKGYQGKAATGGLSWGFIKPLYGFANGNSLDFEAGISAGLVFRSRTTYELERESNCYHATRFEPGKLQFIPVVSDIRLGFVYRLGNYPSTKKYRWRYDCDLAYKDKFDEMLEAENKRKDSIAHYKADYDSIYRVFMRVYTEQMEILGNDTDTKAKKGQAIAPKTDNGNANKKKKSKDKMEKGTKRSKKKKMTEQPEDTTKQSENSTNQPEDDTNGNDDTAKPEEQKSNANETDGNTDEESTDSDNNDNNQQQ